MIAVLQLLSTALRLLAHNESTSVTEDSIEGIINTATPVGEPLSSKYKKDVTYFTTKEVFPEILSSFAKDLRQTKHIIVNNYGPEAEKDIQFAIESISKLEKEIDSNKPLTPLTSSRSDVPLWNAFLEEQTKREGTNMKWYTSSFLYTECYFYRRVKHIFELSNTLQNFDYCLTRKQSTLIHSMGSCSLFANYLVKELSNPMLPLDKVRREVIRLIKLSLWGNRFDMSISYGIVTSLKDDPMELVDNLEEYILVDDSEKIWNKLVELRNANTTIDIVHDNAGYELFADLCLADFLLTFGFATTIRFHVKSIPWYVSDALTHDVKWTADILSQMGTHSASLPQLSSRWNGYLDSGRWELHTSDFWTLPYEYCVMQKIDPGLYEKLSKPSLLIFKGDLNYRKLMAGINWPPTESFTTALQGFQPTSIIALRAIKSEAVCGLQPSKFKELAAINPKWRSCGDYGLVQYSEK